MLRVLLVVCALAAVVAASQVHADPEAHGAPDARDVAPVGAVAWVKQEVPVAKEVAVGCPDDCSGHGRCRRDGTCLCDGEWQGTSCAEPVVHQKRLKKDFDKFGEGTVYYRMMTSQWLWRNADFVGARTKKFDQLTLTLSPGMHKFEKLLEVPFLTQGDMCTIGAHAVKIVTTVAQPSKRAALYVGVSDGEHVVGFVRQWGDSKSIGSALVGRDGDMLSEIHVGPAGGRDESARRTRFTTQVSVADDTYVFGSTDSLSEPVIWKATRDLDCTRPLKLVLFGERPEAVWQVYGIEVEVTKANYMGRMMAPDWLNSNSRIEMPGYAKLSDNHALQMNPWNTMGKIMKVPLVPAGGLAKGTYSVRLDVSARSTVTKNNLYLGISDGKHVLGYNRKFSTAQTPLGSAFTAREDKANMKTYRALASAPAFNRAYIGGHEWFTLRYSRDTVFGRNNDFVAPVAAVTTPALLNKAAALALDVYADSRYELFKIEYKIRREGNYQGTWHRHMTAEWLHANAEWSKERTHKMHGARVDVAAAKLPADFAHVVATLRSASGGAEVNIRSMLRALQGNRMFGTAIADPIKAEKPDVFNFVQVGEEEGEEHAPAHDDDVVALVQLLAAMEPSDLPDASNAEQFVSLLATGEASASAADAPRHHHNRPMKYHSKTPFWLHRAPPPPTLPPKATPKPTPPPTNVIAMNPKDYGVFADTIRKLKKAVDTKSHEKLFEEAIDAKPQACAQGRCSIRVEVAATALTKENTVYVGVSDGTTVVGFRRVDKSYGHIGHAFAGKDGARLTPVVGPQGGAVHYTPSFFRFTLDLMDDFTSVYAQIDRATEPAVWTEAPRIDVSKPLKLVVFADGPLDKTAFYYVDVTVMNSGYHEWTY